MLPVIHKSNPLILHNTCGILPTVTSDWNLSHEGSNSPTISQFSIRNSTSRETTWLQIKLVDIHLRAGKWYKVVYNGSLAALFIIDCESSLKTEAKFTSKRECIFSSNCLQDSILTECLKLPLRGTLGKLACSQISRNPKALSQPRVSCRYGHTDQQLQEPLQQAQLILGVLS